MRIRIYWFDMLDEETGRPIERTWSCRQDTDVVLDFTGTDAECAEEAKRTIASITQKPIRHVWGFGILPQLRVELIQTPPSRKDSIQR